MASESKKTSENSFIFKPSKKLWLKKIVNKIAVTFEPIMLFWCPLRFRIYKTNTYLIYIMTKDWNSNSLGVMTINQEGTDKQTHSHAHRHCDY